MPQSSCRVVKGLMEISIFPVPLPVLIPVVPKLFQLVALLTIWLPIGVIIPYIVHGRGFFLQRFCGFPGWFPQVPHRAMDQSLETTMLLSS